MGVLGETQDRQHLTRVSGHLTTSVKMRYTNKILVVLLLGIRANVWAEIWPPFGHLTPNNYIPPPICTYEQERVYEDILEEVCTTEDVKECQTELVTEEELKSETQCEERSEQVCEKDECDFNNDDECEHCDDETSDCREKILVESKRECSYETKMEKKCFRAYEVTYIDDCRQFVETECKLFDNFLCDKVNKTKCKKVAQFPSEKCQKIPRLTETCHEIPVRRSLGMCRLQCRNQTEKNCKNIIKKVCKEVAVQKPVQKNKEICKTVPNKTCKIDKVKRLKLIPKKICSEFKPTEKPKLSEGNQNSTK